MWASNKGTVKFKKNRDTERLSGGHQLQRNVGFATRDRQTPEATERKYSQVIFISSIRGRDHVKKTQSLGRGGKVAEKFALKGEVPEGGDGQEVLVGLA